MDNVRSSNHSHSKPEVRSDAAPYNYFEGELPDRFAAQPGDLLFAWSGTPGTSFGAHVWHGPEAWINQHIFRVDFSSHQFDRDFLRAALDANLTSYIEQAQGGVGLAHITKAKLNESVLLVPPLGEQRRIADRLDRIEARRASTSARLTRARALLERFRNALLAAACSRRLTEDWREAHSDATADLLLVQLNGSRHTAKSRRPDARGERGLTSEMQLELLPSSWNLVRLGDILDVGTGATPLRKNRAYYDDGTIPWVTSGAVNARMITSPTELITPLALKDTNVKRFPPGTLLIAMYGEGQTRGRVAELAIDAGTNQAVAAVLFTKATAALRPFVRLFFEDSYRRVRALSVGGVQPNLNLGTIKDTLFPLPPLEEQVEIVSRATVALAAADGLASQAARANTTLVRISRATLAKAFRGELVASEAADERAPEVSRRG
jgi:type I restriction enzyme S subunit